METVIGKTKLRLVTGAIAEEDPDAVLTAAHWLGRQPRPRTQIRIPTGFRPKAQGCEARSTLGQTPQRISTPKGLHPAFLFRRYNPVGVEAHTKHFDSRRYRRLLVRLHFHEPDGG